MNDGWGVHAPPRKWRIHRAGYQVWFAECPWGDRVRGCWCGVFASQGDAMEYVQQQIRIRQEQDNG